MNLSELKKIYLNKNNIQAVNQIVEIENIQIQSGVSINKIIKYLLSNCTSKNNRKTLSLLESYFPTSDQISDTQINQIKNRNIAKPDYSQINIESPDINIEKQEQEEIKILKYKNIKKKNNNNKQNNNNN